MELVKKNHIGKRGELDLIQRRKVIQKASLKGAPSSVSPLSGTAPSVRGTGEALGQSETSDLVQRRASHETVESASLEGAPSSVSQSIETEPRMRVPEKVLDQDEGSDLLQI